MNYWKLFTLTKREELTTCLFLSDIYQKLADPWGFILPFLQKWYRSLDPGINNCQSSIPSNIKKMVVVMAVIIKPTKEGKSGELTYHSNKVWTHSHLGNILLVRTQIFPKHFYFLPPDALRNFGSFVQFKKHEKTPKEENKSNNPSWMFFRFFNLQKWYQIAESVIIEWSLSLLMNTQLNSVAVS